MSGIVQSIEAAVAVHEKDLKVIFINDAFESIFEIRGEDAVGASPEDFLPNIDPAQKAAVIARLKKTFQTGEKSPYHVFPYQSPSGKRRHLVAISIPVTDKDHEITHVMSVIHDVTRRKELERDAIESARLASIADMAYALAHEISNPLTGIRLGLSTLYQNILKDENRQILDSVMKDLTRIQNTVKSFLKSRKEKPPMQDLRTAVFGEIIDEVLFHLSGQLEKKGLKVTKHLTHEDAGVSINKDCIHMVLLNVLLNAIEATPPEGRIMIRTLNDPNKRNHLTSRFLTVEVEDSGAGIEKDDRDKVFNAFYSTKERGTGLGLSICKHLITQHNGTMDLGSTEGGGTTVRFHVPTVRV